MHLPNAPDINLVINIKPCFLAIGVFSSKNYNTFIKWMYLPNHNISK